MTALIERGERTSIYVYTCTYRDERKKQARSNKQTRQSDTAHPRQSLFLEKMSCLRCTYNYKNYTGHIVPCVGIKLSESTVVLSI